jgi:UPF0716 protein FxsA
MKGRGLFFYQQWGDHMFLTLIILFTALPAAELFILIKLGQSFGLTRTFLLIIGTGIVGAYIAKMQGLAILQRIQEQTQKGLMPTDDMFDGALVLIGGVTLLTPGLITDILGFLFLLPLSRALIKRLIKKIFKKSFSNNSGIITVEASSTNDNNEEADIHDFLS